MAKMTNFTPLLRLENLGKVYPQLLFTHFGHHIVNEKHAFVKRKSTTSNQLNLYNFVVEYLNSLKDMHTIYTNFSKVFDPTFPHHL